MTQRVRRRDRQSVRIARIFERMERDPTRAIVAAETSLLAELTDAEFAARLAEVRPKLEAAMRQGVAEAEAARETSDRAWAEGWKRLEGMRFR